MVLTLEGTTGEQEDLQGQLSPSCSVRPPDFEVVWGREIREAF